MVLFWFNVTVAGTLRIYSSSLKSPWRTQLLTFYFVSSSFSCFFVLCFLPNWTRVSSRAGNATFICICAYSIGGRVGERREEGKRGEFRKEQGQVWLRLSLNEARCASNVSYK